MTQNDTKLFIQNQLNKFSTNSEVDMAGENTYIVYNTSISIEICTISLGVHDLWLFQGKNLLWSELVQYGNLMMALEEAHENELYK